MFGFFPREEPGFECQCPVQRSLFNIVWSCGWTTIICAWVAVHPNVPPSGRWRGLWRRLNTMFWMIVAPELMLAWAVRQWSAAWEIRDTVNGTDEGFLDGFIPTIKGRLSRGSAPVSNRWTMKHGHLLAMGGISTVDPSFENSNECDPRGQILTIEHYKEASRVTDRAIKLNLRLRKIKQSSITDRSKGDCLSKLITILQTSWFILQCIARSHQGLALTELELSTLALASLNAVTYAFWWHKPLGVQEPIIIYFEMAQGQQGQQVVREKMSDRQLDSEVSAYSVVSGVRNRLKSSATSILESSRDPSDEGPCVAIRRVLSIPLLILFSLLLWLFLPFPLGIIFLLKILTTKPVIEDQSDTRGLFVARNIRLFRKIRYRFTSFIARVSQQWLSEILDASYFAFLVGWLFILPALFFFLLATTILFLPFLIVVFLIPFIFASVFGIITSDTVAPSAEHVPPFYAPKTKSDKYSRMVVFALFGVIFGGLHCMGWNFTFPTSFEQSVWRASSLAITVIPIIVAPADYVLENFELNKGYLKFIRLILDLIHHDLLLIYLPARLLLIGQAIALLRNQPQSAFLAVDWAQYVPHIF